MPSVCVHDMVLIHRDMFIFTFIHEVLLMVLEFKLDNCCNVAVVNRIVTYVLV
jgi:hypothetical protein